MKPIDSLRTISGHPVALPRTRQGSSRRLFPLFVLASVFAAVSSHAQTAAPAAAPAQEEEEVLVLTPFEVTSSDGSQGYTAATTLAGNRLKTELRDVGSAIQVVTPQFLKDTGATDNASLLQYTTGTEVGGLRGNFAGFGDAAQLNEDTIRPSENTRVRGLAAADNTRDYFRSDIPWDAYNVDRVELQRGANSILFGQGSPAGIINTGLKTALFRNSGEAEIRVDSYGGLRGTIDLNQVLVPKELAIRISALSEEEKYRQEEAFAKDNRLYAALRYEPKALNHDGLITSIKANFETGRIRSNNPRTLPPADAITSWFDLKQPTYNQFQAFDHLSNRPNHGQFRVNLASTGAKNPAYVPQIGTFGFPSGRDGPTVFMSGGNQTMMVTDVIGAFVSGGRAPNGSIDGGIAAMPDNGWVSFNGTAQSAINNNEPYSKAGLWKNNLLRDASVFDFYNHLIDGDSKREWQDFHVGNLSLSQTYFHNRLGISADFSKEHYENGQKALLPGEVRLQVDPMAVYGDGSPDAGLVANGEPYSNGTKNPNVGRAFVSSNNAWSNRSVATDRESARATVFVQHDFAEKGSGWFRKFLGQHTLTGLFGKDTVENDARAWQRYGIFDSAYYNLSGKPDQRFNGSLTPVQIVYLGDSLLGKSLSGASIPSVSGNTTITSGAIRYFNSTWKATGVNPADPWQNGFYLAGDPSRNSTQSENPANYTGWTTTPLNIVDAEGSDANRDRLTTRATLDKATTESQALVWQGKWLANSLVTTFGWRKDIAESWAFDMSPNDFPVSADRGAVNLSPSYYKLPATGQSVEVESKSYSIVAHLSDLPFLRTVTERLPVNVSLYYNKSTNFKPDSSRVDIYGEQLAAPAGKTEDVGIRLESKNGRFAVRVNRYETTNSNASSTQINAASIGSWMQLTQNFANVFGYNILPWGYDATAAGQTGSSSDIFNGITGVWQPMRYNFHYFANRPLQAGEILSADGAWIVSPALEQKIIDNTRTFQRAVDPRFWQAWRIKTFGDFGPSTSDVTYSVPTGFAITEDNVSKGWEIELSAQPTKNWRVLFNASKTDARRTNIGNANMREFMDLVAAALKVPDGVSKLHHYWGTEDVVTAGKNWFDGEGLAGAPGSEWRLAQLVENTTVPELREWRANLITNYDFDSGRFKGISVGGGLRYQSDVIVGYPPMGNPNDPTTVEYDLNNPYRGPAETNLDLWVGYNRRLSTKVNWRIQLNVRDAFQSKELIPISYQPNGTVAAYRIVSGQSFSLSNTFEF